MGDFVLVLALIWGVILALFLQFVPWGRFLAKKRTWSTVVLGVGLDLGLLALVIPFEWWLWAAKIIGLSAIGIIIRSLYNEWDEWKRVLRVLAGKSHEPEEPTLE